MTRRGEIDRLKDIAKICEAQRVRAELEVERLNLELDRLGQRLKSESRHLKASEAGWAKAVTGASLQLTASAAWSADIVRARANIGLTSAEIDDRRTSRQGLCETLRSVSARGDAVDALSRQEMRRTARRREEAALEDHSVRAGPGWRASCE